VSGVHAIRVAAKLRRELQIEVDTEHGRYGEYKVFVDGSVVVDGGAMVTLGVLPASRNTVNAVRDRLSR
jgi:hypothetical protein